MTKICSNKDCIKVNPQSLSAFSKDKRALDGFQSRCKGCRSHYNKSNSEKAKLQSKKWQKNNPQRVKGLKLRTFWPNLGANEALIEYKKLLQSQRGLCAICRLPETQRHQHGKLRDLAVDHDHKTGKVRGLLCGNCNHGLGRFKDSVYALQRAVEYLGVDQ